MFSKQLNGKCQFKYDVTSFEELCQRYADFGTVAYRDRFFDLGFEGAFRDDLRSTVLHGRSVLRNNRDQSFLCNEKAKQN